MVQKPWFKVFVWFMATFFFFLSSGVVISIFKPGPSENEVMRFMSGMMSAMDSSIMGIAMGVEGNSTLRNIIAYSYFMLVPIIAISIVIGFIIRIRQGGKKNV